MKRNRNFEDTKSLIKTLVVLAIICCVACLFFTHSIYIFLTFILV